MPKGSSRAAAAMRYISRLGRVFSSLSIGRGDALLSSNATAIVWHAIICSLATNRHWRCSLRVAIVFFLFIGICCLFGIGIRCRSAAAAAAHRPNLDKAEHACAFEARDLAQQVADKVEGGLDGSVDERAVLLPAHDDAAAGCTQQTSTSREKDRHECVRTDSFLR